MLNKWKTTCLDKRDYGFGFTNMVNNTKHSWVSRCGVLLVRMKSFGRRSSVPNMGLRSQASKLRQ